MSEPQIIYWSPSTPDGITYTDIAPIQSVNNGEDVELKNNIPPKGFKYDGIIRSIIIKYSSAIPAGIIFTINGIGISVDDIGNPTGIVHLISEILPGNVGGQVESVNIFTEIHSITISGGNTTNLSVGYGSFGITQYVLNDMNATVGQLQLQAQVVNGAGLLYDFNLSLNMPESPDSNGQLIPFGIENGIQIAFIFCLTLIGGLGDNFTLALPSVTTSWLKISATTTDSLYFTVLQQGTNSR